MLYQTDFEQKKKKSCIKIFNQNFSVCNNQGKTNIKVIIQWWSDAFILLNTSTD